MGAKKRAAIKFRKREVYTDILTFDASLSFGTGFENRATTYGYRVIRNGSRMVITVGYEQHRQIQNLFEKHGVKNYVDMEFRRIYVRGRTRYEFLMINESSRMNWSDIKASWVIHNPVKVDEACEFVEKFLANS